MDIIYKLENKTRGKLYIGRGDACKRKSNHFSSLKQRTHHSEHMNSDYLIDGEQAFYFEVIACPLKPEYLKTLEDTLIRQYNAMNPNFGYNRSDNKGRSQLSKFLTSERLNRGNYCFLPGVNPSDMVSNILFSTYQSSLHTKLTIDKLKRTRMIKG